jgi:hypothetical protein
MMKKIIVLFTLCCSLFTFLAAGSVTAEVSQHEVVAGNTVQLRLKATGKRAEFPDIQEIDGAKVLGRSQTQNNSISYINGKMSNAHSTSLILTFAPEQTSDDGYGIMLVSVNHFSDIDAMAPEIESYIMKNFPESTPITTLIPFCLNNS